MASGFLRQVQPLHKVESEVVDFSVNSVERGSSILHEVESELGDLSAHLIKPVSSASQTSTRSNGKSAWRGIYDTIENREAVKKISNIGMKYDTTLHSASLRWLAYHSRLSSNDAIVLSASSWWDLEDQIGELVKGPLPEELVNVIDEVVGPMRTRGANSSC
jgi:hypothetical protein